MGIVNSETWKHMLSEDIEWLRANTEDTLERQHIILCLEWLKMYKPQEGHRIPEHKTL